MSSTEEYQQQEFWKKEGLFAYIQRIHEEHWKTLKPIEEYTAEEITEQLRAMYEYRENNK